MEWLFHRQGQRVGFALLLLLVAGFAKLWMDFGTIWAPILLLVGALGILCLIFAILLKTAQRRKANQNREAYNRGMAEALGDYAADYPETAPYARGVGSAVRVLASGRDIIPFLDVNRDPHLWAHVVMGLNYDAPDTYDVLFWMTKQPDCEAAIARDIWVQVNGTDMVSGKDNRGLTGRLPVAERISIQDDNGGYPTGRLGLGFLNHDDLLARAEDAEETAKGLDDEFGDHVSLLDAPLGLLAMQLEGPPPNPDAHMVDEEGIHGRPKDYLMPPDARG